MSEQNILSFKNYVDSKIDEEKIIKERGMSQNEIDSLIDSAEDVAQDILLDDKRKKEERETAKETLRWIRDVRKTFEKDNSLHPNAVNGLMRVTAMKQGKYGFMNRDNPKIPSNYEK
jgi:hypothetical protein